tara:strand:+ start:8576 stop:9481 length:906 start_codon:yes stop_codon:yes gene_type:complete
MNAKLSIGLPVYNEIKYVEKTLDSILSQSLKFHELIIVDNHSDDGTYQILNKYSKKDKRIKLYRNKKNLGMIDNYNKVFEFSSGDYFSWIGAHDLYEQNYFEDLISKFKKNSKLSLVFSNVAKIDKDNKFIDKNKKTGFILKSNILIRNIIMPFLIKGSGDMVCGVFKTSDLKKTTLFSKKVLNPDYLLITQISNIGKIDKVENPLRKRRYFRDEEVNFSNWSEKYISLKNRYIKNNGKVNYLLKKLPILVMAFNIFKVMYLKKRIYDPYCLLIGTYTSLIYLFRHRSGLLVDIIQLLKLR